MRRKYVHILFAVLTFLTTVQLAKAADCCWDDDATITKKEEADLSVTYTPTTHTNTSNAKREYTYTIGSDSLQLNTIAISKAHSLAVSSWEGKVEVSGAWIKGKFSCTGGTSTPAQQFNASCTRTFSWDIQGDVGNLNPISDGWGKATGDHSIAITTTSGATTDMTDKGECEGVKKEVHASTWIPKLNIKWNSTDITPSLTWDDAASGVLDNTWADVKNKLEAYNKTVSNVVGSTSFTSAYFKADLSGLSYAKTTNNAKKAYVTITSKITSFSFTQV
jgi:hypothetical protein